MFQQKWATSLPPDVRISVCNINSIQHQAQSHKCVVFNCSICKWLIDKGCRSGWTRNIWTRCSRCIGIFFAIPEQTHWVNPKIHRRLWIFCQSHASPCFPLCARNANNENNIETVSRLNIIYSENGPLTCYVPLMMEILCVRRIKPNKYCVSKE